MSITEAIRNLFLPEVQTYELTKKGTKYTITKKGSKRFLKVNGIIYSELDNNSLYTHSYHDYFAPLPLLYTKPKVLVLGLGAGTIPSQLYALYKGNISIDVVDINRDYVALTKKFLGKKINFRIIIDDAAHYVEEHRRQYDIIVQDIFVSDHIPQQYLDDVFISSAYAALRKDGILAINYAPEVIYLPFYTHKLHRHFQHVYRIKHISLGNYILISSKEFDKRFILGQIKSKMPLSRENVHLYRAYSGMQ